MSKNNIVKDVKKLVTDIYADKSRGKSHCLSECFGFWIYILCSQQAFYESLYYAGNGRGRDG